MSTATKEEEFQSGLLFQVLFETGYVLQSKIGSGNFSSVYKASRSGNTEEKKYYAIKSIIKSKTTHVKFEKELTFLNRLTTLPYFIQIHEAMETSLHWHLVLDYCPRGTVWNHVVTKSTLKDDNLLYCAAELSYALNSLHKLEIVHFDIKPENILISNSGHTAITDFGVSVEEGKLNNKNVKGGTKSFMPPEFSARSTYNHSFDYWSLGVTLHMLAFRTHPMTSIDKKTILKKPNFSIHLKGKFKNFLRCLFDSNPEKRLGSNPKDFTAIQTHAFFKNIVWEQIAEGKGMSPFQ